MRITKILKCITPIEYRYLNENLFPFAARPRVYTIAVHSIASCSARLPTQEVLDRTVDGNLYYEYTHTHTHTHRPLVMATAGSRMKSMGCIYKLCQGASIPSIYLIYDSQKIIFLIRREMCIYMY